jgi:hypothetical protein
MSDFSPERAPKRTSADHSRLRKWILQQALARLAAAGADHVDQYAADVEPGKRGNQRDTLAQ